jgi:ribosomal protein S18 acetylase RimI-like enzyme
MVRVQLSAGLADLVQVRALLEANHARAVDPALWESQGYVTMDYTVDQLASICGPYRHVVAKDGDSVVGYALVLLPEQKAPFTILDDMFNKIAAGSIDGKPIREGDYFVMGQVCIAHAYRGQGIFGRLYQALKQQMERDFAYVITEVSDKNVRSMGAHRALGFRDIAVAGAAPSEWHVVAWDWTTAADGRLREAAR